jgi:gliding motility-associated-like protein
MSVQIKLRFAVALLFTGILVKGQIAFIPNHNQWNEHVLYRAEISSGVAFFEANKITYAYYSSEDVKRAHEESHHMSDSVLAMGPENIRCFAFEVEFVNAQQAIIQPTSQKKHNVNYFIGNDESQWANNVPVFEKLEYGEIYPGIDVQYYSSGNQLKYDFIVAAGSDPSKIVMQYNGQKSISLDHGALLVDIGFTTIEEVIPVAYQVVDGIRLDIRCEFVLKNNQVQFSFPGGYDKSLPLIIDPLVLASTFSGGVGTTGGFSATYDKEGNIYSAGDAFSLGLPVTPGAYSVNFTGQTDLAIFKFNPDGSSLLYCTYIGGSGYEFPQNLAEKDGKLYVFGATFSGNFPVTATAYDTVESGICDIYIACLDNTGSNLLGSTYVGGTWGEGSSLLTPYYPDRLRGCIEVARNGDVIVCSSTTSNNFPATPGAFRTTTTGAQDAVVFRMNSALTTMVWATYMGSGVHDIALGLKEAADGSIYVCGGTNNMFTPFPTVAGCWNTTPMGGTDAFVVNLSADGSTMNAGTLYGGTLLDCAFYIDLDKDGDVYICGISRQGTPVTEGVWFVPNAPQFIAKFNSSLSELMYSTTIGQPMPATALVTGSGGPTVPGPPSMVGPEPLRANNNAITAFMVDECERVYVAAYVGIFRWPTTDDTLFTYSFDNQFFIGVVEEDATALLSSTYYTGQHIDGGSGHFDENGILYQVACIGGSVFSTTPWAYSNGSNAGPYDICTFKVNMHVDLIDTIMLPNVFTPNNDGINDSFSLGDVVSKAYDLTIYDRNGTPVYHTAEPQIGWDGTFNGNPCAEGVYFYAVHYWFCTELREKSGFVHLARGQ